MQESGWKELEVGSRQNAAVLADSGNLGRGGGGEPLGIPSPPLPNAYAPRRVQVLRAKIRKQEKWHGLVLRIPG